MYCEHIHALQQQIERLNDIVTDQCEIVKQRDDTITELCVNCNKHSNTSQQQPVIGNSSDKRVQQKLPATQSNVFANHTSVNSGNAIDDSDKVKAHNIINGSINKQVSNLPRPVTREQMQQNNVEVAVDNAHKLNTVSQRNTLFYITVYNLMTNPSSMLLLMGLSVTLCI